MSDVISRVIAPFDAELRDWEVKAEAAETTMVDMYHWIVRAIIEPNRSALVSDIGTRLVNGTHDDIIRRNKRVNKGDLSSAWGAFCVSPDDFDSAPSVRSFAAIVKAAKGDGKESTALAKALKQLISVVEKAAAEGAAIGRVFSDVQAAFPATADNIRMTLGMSAKAAYRAGLQDSEIVEVIQKSKPSPAPAPEVVAAAAKAEKAAQAAAKAAAKAAAALEKAAAKAAPAAIPAEAEAAQEKAALADVPSAPALQAAAA